MASNRDLAKTLFLLRLSIASVFFIWTVDKILRPDHAALVFEHFYFIKGLTFKWSALIGALEGLLLIAFVAGYKKKLTYGAIFFFHFISTISSYKQYLDPLEGVNILFWAGIPMLAACYTLYVLREHDTMYVVESKEV